MLLLIVRMSAVPGKRDALTAMLHALFARGAEGLVQYSVGLANDDADAIIVVEEWRDAAMHQAFFDGDAFREFRESATPLVGKAPESTSYALSIP